MSFTSNLLSASRKTSFEMPDLPTKYISVLLHVDIPKKDSRSSWKTFFK